MSTSSAVPEVLIRYAGTMHAEGQAVLDHLAGAGLAEKIDAVRVRCAQYLPACIGDIEGPARVATLGAQELDVWAGAVGQAFLAADGSGSPGLLTLDDSAVIAQLPPGLADPPAETRARVAEGQRLFDELMRAADARDHDRIEQLLATLDARQGDTAFMAGFALKVQQLGGVEQLQQRLEDGMRPRDRGGFFGGMLDLAEGAWDSVTGTIEMLGGLTVQVFTDPGKWADNWANLGKGLWHGVTHPVEFVETLIDVDGFQDNPERWLGSFVPDLAATFFSGGAAAGVRGVKGLDAVTDLSEAAGDLRRLEDGARLADDLGATGGALQRLDADLTRVNEALRDKLVAQGVPADRAEAIADKMTAGTQFNRDNRERYPFNEVYLTNGKVLDSYDPVKGEIVSRKFTQLADVQPATARAYINELATKYQERQQIAASPSVLRQEEVTGQKIAGERLAGRLVLEVPPQTGVVRPEVLQHARAKNVIIRTTEGQVLN